MEKVVIILCDTLRAKSLPHYGNERNTIPNLLPIINRDFVFYKKAYAPSPWTVPSHLSLFTGLYPTQVMENRTSFRLNTIFTTLADLFKDSGYKTVALSTNELLSKKFGYNKGFDRFFQIWLPNPEEEDITFGLNADNDFERLLRFSRLIVTEKNKANLFKGIKQKVYKRFGNIFNDSTPSTNKTMRLLRQHISENKEQKLFYFVNLMQAHEKYNPPSCTRNRFVKYNAKHGNYYEKKTLTDHYAVESFGKEFLEYIKLLYEEEILYLDLVISDFVQFLKENALYDDSTIIITSDHGEQFGENGHFAHGFSVYEPVIKIPFYIKWPGKSENNNKDRNELVMLQDIYSTFLSLLNHWHPCPFSSIDLNSSNKRSWILSQFPDMSHNIRGCLKKRQTFSIKEIGLEEDSLAAYVFDDGIKIIENGNKIKCYSLKNDPDEKKPYPISTENRRRIESIKNTLM